MTIYFNPAYHGHLYVDLDNKFGQVAFDCCYKNVAGLVDMLASMLGIHVKKRTDGERLVKYHHAIKQYIVEHPECVFAQSFKIDGMGTASQCLRWRDELARYGWTKDIPASSPRLRSLSLIEDYFDCDGDDKLWSMLMSALMSNADILDGSKIIVPFKKQVFAPYITELLDTLASGGCEVCYHEADCDYERLLDDVDGIKVWEFETERDAMLYLATTNPARFDVWIDHDSRMLDKYLHSANRPTVGSKVADSYPQSCQLLTLALKLLRKPVDAVTLVQWLQLPKHPVKNHRDLANKIISSGGYHNSECKDLVDDKDGWLPDLHIGATENACDKVKIKTLEDCIKRYKKWAQSQINLSANIDDYSFPCDYFDGLIDLCDAMNALLVPYRSTGEVDCDVIDGWCQHLTSGYKRPQYPAIKSCMEVVESAASMVDTADRVIVCDAYSDCRHSMSCSFLSSDEREALSQHIKLWDCDAEREYHKSLLLMPLLMANKELVLVVCKKSGNADLPQHPLITWLKGRLGDRYKNIVEHPELNSQYYTTTTKEAHHHCDAEYISFGNKHLLRYRKHESPSSIEDLFECPLEYLFDKMVYLTSNGETEMKAIQITKGVVAHYIIATLFSPAPGCDPIGADMIRVRIDDKYDDTFNIALHCCGSSLLRAENSLECRRLRKEIRECVDILVDVIDKNSLSVISCEYNVEDIDIGINGAGTSVPIGGRVDMVLCDSEGCAVVFDLKYTGRPGKYYDKLSGGTAYQLALYAQMLKASAGIKITRVGYYIMPRGVLYTCDPFTGEHVWHIPRPAATNAYTTVKNEYQRILEELADGKAAYRDTEGKCLIRPFSSLKLFSD